MEYWFKKLMDVSSITKNKPMVNELLAGLTQELGFDRYAYLKIHPAGSYAVSNYHLEWQDRYFSERYETLDPVIAQAKSTKCALTWDNAKERKAGSKAVRKFCDEADDFGIRTGVSIPVWTGFGHMSLMTLSSQKANLPFSRTINPAMAANAVTLLHANIELFEITPSAQSIVRLTVKQAALLRWAAEGKSMKDIAMIENMSFHNVNFHLNNARKALNAGTLAQATATATKLRLI